MDRKQEVEFIYSLLQRDQHKDYAKCIDFKRLTLKDYSCYTNVVNNVQYSFYVKKISEYEKNNLKKENQNK